VKNFLLWFGLALTAAYMFAAYRYGVFDSAFITNFERLPLNNQGDALAGFFAPLAFLWLFVATMIQSQELAAQREEIRASREVSKEQTKAAKDQAAFLNAQTAAMEAQTKLLTEQIDIARQSADRQHRIALFDKRVQIYKEVSEYKDRDFARNLAAEQVDKKFYDMADRAEFLFGMDFVHWLLEIGNTIGKVDHLRMHRGRMARDLQLKLWDAENPARTQAILNKEYQESVQFLNDQLRSSTITVRFYPYMSLTDRPLDEDGYDLELAELASTN